MKWKELLQRGGRLRRLGAKYRYVFLVLLAGILLLLIPDGRGGRGTAPAAEAATDFDLAGLERKLEHTLAQIDGAGEVTVLLTLKSDGRRVLAETRKEGERDPVIVSRGSGQQETVAVQEYYPEFQGALIVCTGGGDPAIQLKIIEAEP